MKRKPHAKPEPVISREILESAKRSIAMERGKGPVKCVVCAAETPAGAAEPLCWVCRRLKISAWRDVEQQMPAQE
jgi:hypothetical protein